MEKEVQASLKIVSFEHLTEEFHSSDRLSDLRISEALECRLQTDITKYTTVRPPRSRQGGASRTGGLFSGGLARHCGSADVGIRWLGRTFRNTLNTNTSLTFHSECNWSRCNFLVVVIRVVVMGEEKESYLATVVVQSSWE